MTEDVKEAAIRDLYREIQKLWVAVKENRDFLDVLIVCQDKTRDCLAESRNGMQNGESNA